MSDTIQHIAEFRRRRESEMQVFVDNVVAPDCIALLDRARAKLGRHYLDFYAGMGTWSLETTPIRGATPASYSYSSRLEQAVMHAATSAPVRMPDSSARRSARFPELVEFVRIVWAPIAHDLNVFEFLPDMPDPRRPS